MAFTVRTKEKQVGVFTVFPEGSLDANTSTVLKDKVESLMNSAAKVIVFDLANLQYISSAGVRIFLATKKAMKKRNGKFVLMNPQPQVKKVFKIINALPSFTIFKDIEELDQYLLSIQKSVLAGDSE